MKRSENFETDGIWQFQGREIFFPFFASKWGINKSQLLSKKFIMLISIYNNHHSHIQPHGMARAMSWCGEIWKSKQLIHETLWNGIQIMLYKCAFLMLTLSQDSLVGVLMRNILWLHCEWSVMWVVKSEVVSSRFLFGNDNVVILCFYCAASFAKWNVSSGEIKESV